MLPIYLIKSNKANKIYAVDINIKPLNQAKRNIKKYNVEEFIEIIHGNGLFWIKKDLKIDICIISGIGGKTIIDILKNDSENISSYILCPNNNEILIRKWIKQKKYFIEKESLIIDNDIIYLIIVINKYSGLKVKNKKDEIFGPFLRRNKNIIFSNYWTLKYYKINNYLYNIPKKNKKYKELKKKIKLIYKELNKKRI